MINFKWVSNINKLQRAIQLCEGVLNEAVLKAKYIELGGKVLPVEDEVTNATQNPVIEQILVSSEVLTEQPTSDATTEKPKRKGRPKKST